MTPTILQMQAMLARIMAAPKHSEERKEAEDDLAGLIKRLHQGSRREAVDYRAAQAGRDE